MEVKRVIPLVVLPLPARPVPIALPVVAIARMTAILPVPPVPMKMSPQRPTWIINRLKRKILPHLGILLPIKSR
jgi:hypothetical protein